jgi:hypothetical protein
VRDKDELHVAGSERVEVGEEVGFRAGQHDERAVNERA